MYKDQKVENNFSMEKKNSIEEKCDKLLMKKLTRSRKQEQTNSVRYHHSRRELFINLESQIDLQNQALKGNCYCTFSTITTQFKLTYTATEQKHFVMTSTSTPQKTLFHHSASRSYVIRNNKENLSTIPLMGRFLLCPG